MSTEKPLVPDRERKTSVSLSGKAVTLSGKITKSNYFDFLSLELDSYQDMNFTPEEARRVSNHLQKLSTGSAAMVPMYCGGQRCPIASRCPLQQMGKAPLGRACHPPGELIRTTNGLVPIEELDPSFHSLPGYQRRRNAIRRGMKEDKKGFRFTVASKDYLGSIVSIKTESSQYRATPDHLCIARFNEKAINKFCVYLMKKDSFWRIGKSVILKKDSRRNSFHMPFLQRLTREDADAMWILGIFSTNTEATLAEETFSIKFGISQTSFVDSQGRSESKYNGLYRWVTTEQLNNHHQQFVKPYCYYMQLLEEIGLSIDYPIFVRNAFKDKDRLEKGPYPKETMFIRASNLIPDIMDVPIFPSEENILIRGGKPFRSPNWESITLSKERYQGKVYALDVEKYQTYFVGDIATHNCPIESHLINEWMIKLIDEYDVDPNNITEIAMINELAEIEIYLLRLNSNMAKVENSELVIDQIVSIGQDGTPILQKQISPFFEAKEKLLARRSKVIKLMVGDRQEKYKKEAALKVRLDDDPSSRMASMRSKLESLSRSMDAVSAEAPEASSEATEPLSSPQSLIDDD